MHIHAYIEAVGLVPADEVWTTSKSSCRLISWKQIPVAEVQVSVCLFFMVAYHF